MNNIRSALEYLNCAEMDHSEWIRVGMALKSEGFDVGVWDEWSSRDPARYHPGECAKRWKTFQGNDNPVTGATIVKMARDRGWTPFSGANGVMDWNDVLEYDGKQSGSDSSEPLRTGTEDLIL